MQLINLITQDPSFRKDAKKLYLSAFPKEERIPWWLLLLNARRNGIQLIGYTDGNALCGFAYSVCVDDVFFLLFFAVEENVRGKGIGSAILSEIRKRYETVIVNVEPLDPNTENFAQRQQRFAFYEKNGFADTGWYVWEIGGKFRVLSTKKDLDIQNYRKLFRKLTCGAWRVRLARASEEEAK